MKRVKNLQVERRRIAISLLLLLLATFGITSSASEDGVSYLGGKVVINVETDETDLYTGQTAQTWVSISNPTSEEITDGSKIRLYMAFSDATESEDALLETVQGKPVQSLGTFQVDASNKDGVSSLYNCTLSKVDKDKYPESCKDLPESSTLYCYEFDRPINGDTISIHLDSNFTNLRSAGGTNQVWVEVVDKEEKAVSPDSENEQSRIDANSQTITWKTKEDNFELKKEGSSFSLNGSYDEETKKTTTYMTGAQYTISLARETTETLEGMGKDYCGSVTMTDVMEIPDGIKITDSIKEAIEKGDYKCQYKYNGGYYYFLETGDGEIIWKMSRNSSTLFQPNSVKVSVDGNKLIFSYQINNSSKTLSQPYYQNELGTAKDVIYFGDKVFELTDTPVSGKEYTVNNSVTAEEYFAFSDKQVDTAKATDTIKLGEADVSFKKEWKSMKYTMGEAEVYTITTANRSAIAYDKVDYIEDPLPDTHYMTAEDIAKMFEGETFSLVIKNGNICSKPSEAQVTLVDGEKIHETYTRTDSTDGKYNGKVSTDSTIIDEKAEISLKRNGDKIEITYGDTKLSCEIDKESIQKALDSLGFVVVKGTTYNLRWDLKGDNDSFLLYGGQTITNTVYTHAKDTTKYTTGDVDNNISTRYLSTNYAYLYKTDSETPLKANNSSNPGISIDLKIEKSASSNGKDLTEAPDDGEVIDYQVTVNHYGTGEYDLLPVADHMNGSQVLLAEAEKNAGADWVNKCEEREINGTKYYLLKEGKYEGVWINGNYADSVTVTKKDGGYNTIIKWYMEDVTGRVTKDFTYKAVVDTSLSGSTYSIGNECWANDHESHRVYDTIGKSGLSGIKAKFVKKIVEKEDIDATDKEEGTNYQLVNSGNTVYYRIAIQATGSDLTINGSNMKDSLPRGMTGVLKWKKDSSLELSSKDVGAVSILKYEGYKDIENSDHYSISDPKVVTGKQTSQQILWDEDFNVTIEKDKTLYIYVRLTFPDGQDYLDYANTFGSQTLINTFSLYEKDSSVYHDLAQPAKAYLQKGVYDKFDVVKATSGSSVWYAAGSSAKGGDLNYYSNNGTYLNVVAYYVTIYNGGNTKLYLNDCQDTLPDGFTYKGMWTGENSTTTSTTSSTTYAKMNIGTGNPNKSSNLGVTVKADASEKGKVTFSFSPSSTGNKSNIDRDGKLFLNTGEYITFVYQCFTNNYEDTKDTATNRIAMPYYDYTNEGVTVSENVSATTPIYSTHTANDGSCELWDNVSAKANGFEGGSSETQWLVSEVTQTRGDIKPGIVKELTSATGDSGTVTKNPATAYPSDVLTWTVTSSNDGDAAMNDYIVTDYMNEPYAFNGKMTYTIKDSKGTTVSYINSSNFTISQPKDGKATFKWSQQSGSISSSRTKTTTLEVNGKPVTLEKMSYSIGKSNYSYSQSYNNRTTDVEVQLTQDENGNYALSMHFKGDIFAIPAGGSSVWTINTKRTDTTMTNKVYTNTCFITPTSEQHWDNTTNKGNVTTLDIENQQADDKVSVRNSAPVTVTYGDATSAVKSIYEIKNPSNKATSKDETNYIALDSKENLFRYTLEVDNTDRKSMKKLIIIDSLPNTEDHSVFQKDDPRFSAFNVFLADEQLDMKVTVTKKDGTVTELSSDQYTVEYNDETNREFTDADWNLKNPEEWKSEVKDARNLRITILNDDGTVIPPSSVVEVSFNAKIVGDAEPGTIAWNSFGYRYQLKGDNFTMDAAPLKVGVKIPPVPTLQKVLKDKTGKETSLAKDSEYQYLIYTGSCLRKTGEALGQSLASDSSRKVTLVTVKVPKGESRSEEIKLDNQKCYSYVWTTGGWSEGKEAFPWTNGMTYNVVELSSSEEAVTFGNINNNTTNGNYTVVYNRANGLTITGTNISSAWKYEITKVDSKDNEKTLKNAWFALYSLNKADVISEEELDKLKEEAKPSYVLDREVTYEGKTYYLVTLEKSDKDGKVTFGGLTRDTYAYAEVRSPLGYELYGKFTIFTKSGSKETTVGNVAPRLDLPETGSTNVWLLAVVAVSMIGIGIMLRKRTS